MGTSFFGKCPPRAGKRASGDRDSKTGPSRYYAAKTAEIKGSTRPDSHLVQIRNLRSQREMLTNIPA